MRKQTWRQRASSALELPTGVLSNGVRMEITDNCRVVIEGCRRIVEYEEDTVRIATAAGDIRFRGRGLCMTRMTAECAVVTGKLLSVEYV